METAITPDEAELAARIEALEALAEENGRLIALILDRLERVPQQHARKNRAGT